MEKLWTVADVATYCGISESTVEQFVEEGKLTGQLLGGHFLRFQPDEIKSLKSQLAKMKMSQKKDAPQPMALWQEQVRDFVYFYDLYLISGALLLILIFYLMLAM